MTEHDAFDQRLAAAFMRLASEAEPMPDPVERARAIVVAHPRRGTRWALRPAPRPGWAWIAVAALLAAAVLGSLIAGGVSIPTPLAVDPDPAPLAVDPARPIPPELFGQWYTGPTTDVFPVDRAVLDFNAPVLIHRPDGSGGSFGRAIAFVDTGPDTGEVIVAATGDCGEGRYRAAFQDPAIPAGDPTAAPLPPGTSSPPTLASDLRLTVIEDSCRARLAILGEAPWHRVLIGLHPGATVSSLRFTEPFRIVIPAGLDVPFDGTAGTLRQSDAATRLSVSHPWWNGFFLDDEPVFRDLCDPSAGTLPDIPATVEVAAAWIRSTAALEYGAPTAVEIDGRTALRVGRLRDCPNGNIPAVATGVYGGIYYAIPTGDDVILWVVRPDTQAEADLADQLARAIDFD